MASLTSSDAARSPETHVASTGRASVRMGTVEQWPALARTWWRRRSLWQWGEVNGGGGVGAVSGRARASAHGRFIGAPFAAASGNQAPTRTCVGGE